MPTLVVVLKLF